MGGQLIYKIIGFFTGVLIIRGLSGEAYGQYSFIYVYLSFFDVFVQFGFNAILVRQISQDPAQAPRILGNAVLFRVLLAAVTLPAACFLIRHLGYPLSVQQGVLLASLQLFLTLRTIYETIFRIHLKMVYSSLWLVAKGLLQFALVAVIAVWKPSLMSFILAALIAGYAALAGFAWHAGQFVRMDFKPDFSLMKKLAGDSFPLLLSGYLTLIYYRIDVFMLSKMTSFTEVGYYSVAVRLTESLDMLSSALLVSLFPILSRTFKENRADFDRTIKKAFRILLLTSMPMVAGGSVVARELIVFLFGAKYLPAASTFSLLLWYTLFCYVGGLLANVLIACGRQKIDAWVSFILVCLNIGLNSVLISRIGFNGAAVATVIVEMCGVLLIAAYAARDKEIRLPLPWNDFLKILILNLAFWGILVVLKNAVLPVAAFIPLGVLIYAVLAVLAGFIKPAAIAQYLTHWRGQPK